MRDADLDAYLHTSLRASIRTHNYLPRSIHASGPRHAEVDGPPWRDAGALAAPDDPLQWLAETGRRYSPCAAQ
jgi:hypothetical protein